MKVMLKELLAHILGPDFRYPVGSYYETTDVNFDPSESFGGTWTKLPTDFSESKKLLWTNSNRSGASQTIALPLSDYDFIDVVFYQDDANDPKTPNVLKVKVGTFGYITLFHALAISQVNENTGSRRITANTNNVVIGDYAYKNRRTDGNLTVSNGYCIPYQIYGIKQTTSYRWHRTA